MKQVTVSAGIILYRGKILIAQRRKDKSLGGFWEFPGGKLEPNETQADCLVREIREEFDIDICVKDFCFTTVHSYDTFTLTMHVYTATWNGEGKIKICDHEQYAWVDKKDLDKYDFSPADWSVVEFVKK